MKPATGYDLYVLKHVRTVVTRKYVEWKILKDSGEADDQSHLKAAWHALLKDKATAQIVEHYERVQIVYDEHGNPVEDTTAQFKRVGGLTSRTWTMFNDYWEGERKKETTRRANWLAQVDYATENDAEPPKEPKPGIGLMNLANPNFPRILDQINRAQLRDWKPTILSLSKRESWPKDADWTPTAPTPTGAYTEWRNRVVVGKGKGKAKAEGQSEDKGKAKGKDADNGEGSSKKKKKKQKKKEAKD